MLVSLNNVCTNAGAVPLAGSVLELSYLEPSLFSLNCTGNETALQDCTYSTTGVCSTPSNAAIRCLGMPLYQFLKAANANYII